MPQLQKPNANFLKAKQLDSQASIIYALLVIFRPFLLYFARLIGDFDSNHARGMHESPGWCRLILGDGIVRRLFEVLHEIKWNHTESKTTKRNGAKRNETPESNATQLIESKENETKCAFLWKWAITRPVKLDVKFVDCFQTFACFDF